MIESFWSTMQRELLDRQQWSTRAQLASAIFEWTEGFYNPVRRHSGLGYRTRSSSRTFTTPPTKRHDQPTETCPGNRVRLRLFGVVGSLDCLYVNHPAANQAAEFKARQLAVAACREIGRAHV